MSELGFLPFQHLETTLAYTDLTDVKGNPFLADVLKLEAKTVRKSEKKIAKRGFDPRTSGLWAQQASTAPLCC